MTIVVDAHGVTDIGRHRNANEDQFLVAELVSSMTVQHTSIPIHESASVFGRSQGTLLLVADGLGGHVAGERASALTISAVSTYVLNSLQWLAHTGTDADATLELQAIAAECHRRLSDSARSHPNEYGMATTITLAIVVWPRLYIMHVGDSRCYLIRDGEARQLTRDHTLRQLYAETQADGIEAMGSNHVLWNVVSSMDDTAPVADVVQLELHLDDQLLLCTDGLYRHVDDEVINQVVSSSSNVHETCHRLVQLANDAGGKDNITVVLSRFSCPRQIPGSEAMVETRIPLDQLVDGARDTQLDDTAELTNQAV